MPAIERVVDSNEYQTMWRSYDDAANPHVSAARLATLIRHPSLFIRSMALKNLGRQPKDVIKAVTLLTLGRPPVKG